MGNLVLHTISAFLSISAAILFQFHGPHIVNVKVINTVSRLVPYILLLKCIVYSVLYRE